MYKFTDLAEYLLECTNYLWHAWVQCVDGAAGAGAGNGCGALSGAATKERRVMLRLQTSNAVGNVGAAAAKQLPCVRLGMIDITPRCAVCDWELLRLEWRRSSLLLPRCVVCDWECISSLLLPNVRGE